MTKMTSWAYKGIDVHYGGRHSFYSWGLRWYARVPWDNEPMLRADSKQGMRELINDVLERHGLIRIGLPKRH